ncbi:MAG: hypothetical protein ACLQBX_02185 [Candidatus Limnocylindrales bacterium]
MEQLSTTSPNPTKVEFHLAPGKSWSSFEQFRVEGGPGLCAAVPDGRVGFLTVHGTEFAILRRRDFDRLFALAQDVVRLTRGLPLIRQAAELVLRTRGEEIAVRHFQELTMTFPSLVTASAPLLGQIEIEGHEPSEPELDLDRYTAPRAPIGGQ